MPQTARPATVIGWMEIRQMENYERLRTVREILIKEEQQRPVQTKLETVSSDLHYYVQIQAQLLSLLSMNKHIVFLLFLNKGSTVIF
jgi:hypothetical protein